MRRWIFLQQAARNEQLRVISGRAVPLKLWTLCCGRGYHIALLRYAAEDEDYYLRYCQRHGLRQEPIMEFSYLLLTSQDSPLARRQVRELDELNDYIEVLHGDTHLPGEESTASRWEVNPNRRIHVRAVQPVLHSAKPAHGLYVVVPHAAARWSSTIWRCITARRRSSRCGMCWYTRSGSLCSRRSSCLCSCCNKQADATIKDSGWKKI